MEYDLNTFLYDVGYLKVGNKSVLNRGALFPTPPPLPFIQHTYGSTQMSRVGIKLKKFNQVGMPRTLLLAEFLFFAEV